MNTKQVKELVLQALEHERGGILIYQTALECAVDERLRDEWKRYLAETKQHERTLVDCCAALAIDPDAETPGRAVVRHNGQALVEAMRMALDAGDEAAAQIVACECVVLAEVKDHANWQLLGKVADALDGAGETLRAAYDAIEDQEDEHLYHTRGWCRELWIEVLGLHAVLPPPEQRRNVKSAIGAARAEAAADLDRTVSSAR